MLIIFPIRCNVNFETVISALNNTKRTENVTLDDIRNILLVNNTERTENVTLDDIGNILLVNLPRQNLKSGGLNL